VERGTLKLEHIAGKDMVADGLTKPLNREKHSVFVKLLGLIDFPTKEKE